MGMTESFPIVIYHYTDRFTLSLFELASKEVIPNFKMFFVASYQELVNTVATVPSPPILIFLDGDKESLDGLEKLMALEPHPDIPFIILSCEQKQELFIRAKELRALSILTKPSNLESMKIIIEMINIFLI